MLHAAFVAVRRRATAALCLTGAVSLVSVGAIATPPVLAVHQGVETGAMPKGVTISPDGTRLYVTNYGQLDRLNVTIHDARTLARVGRIDVPGIVVESAISPDGRTLYLSNFRRNSVQFVDVGSRQVTREIHVGSHPKILVLSRDGRRLFAANWNGRSVSEVDTATGRVTRTLAVGEHPRGMALTRSGRLYVANFSDHTIDVFDGPALDQHHRIRRVCRIPRHLALSPDDRTLYISCFSESSLAAMDTVSERITHRVSVGRSPKANDVLPGGRYVVTADYGGSGATLVDTRDWTAQRIDIPAMDHASGVVAARRGLRFYVTGWYDGHLFSVGLEHDGPRYVVPRALQASVRAQRSFHDQHPAE